MNDDISEDLTEDRLLGQAASEFLAASARGENPSVGDYAKRYPAIARLIKQALPAVAMINGSATEQDSGHAGRLPQMLGDFRIVQEIGRGGMGVVYEAEQVSMGRKVALKILPLTAMLDETRLERFHLEVRAAATLDHPHCVPIYAVGEDHGVHYYAMKLISGHTLADVIHQLQKKDRQPEQPIRQGSTNGKPGGRLEQDRINSQQDDTAKVSQTDILSISQNSNSQEYFRSIAKLGVQAAEALHHAHERGIVHRDIKPSNLILDTNGSIWITDFGLARIESDAGVTMTGDVLGTLRYMSPEQALGHRALVNHRADIYSLGITLYELLALRPAVQGEDRAKILRDFAENEPPSLRQLVPAIPTELETIVRKSIEKNPSDRYATAQEMADDLGRYLRHEPILAKRSTPTQRTIKWVRRHPTAACLIAVSLVAMLSVLGLSLRHTSELANLNVDLKQSLTDTETARDDAVQHQSLMKHYVYMADIQLAYRAWEDNDLRACEHMLLKHLPTDPEATPGIEWRLLWRLSHRPTTTIDKISSALYTMTFSPEGNVYAVAGEDSVVRFYDTNGDRLIDQFPTSQIEINSLDFSPDGQHLATAGDDGTVKLWHWSDHTLLTTFQAYAEKADGAVYLPDGNSMITWGKNPSVLLWDLESGKTIGSFESPGNAFECVCLSDDGEWLFTGGIDGTLTIFDIERLKKVDSVSVRSRVNCIAHAPEKNMIFAGSMSGAVTGWHLGDEQPFFRIDRAESIQCIAIDPEETTVAFGDYEGVIHVCDLNDPTEVTAAPSHLSEIQSLHFTQDGTRIVSCGRDGRIINHPRGPRSSPYFHTHKLEEPSQLQWLSVVGNHQLVGCQVGHLMSRFFMLDTNHLETPAWEVSLPGHYSRFSDLGRPGRYLATYNNGGGLDTKRHVIVLEANTGSIVHRLPLEREPCSIASCDKTSMVAVTYSDGIIQLCDIASGEQIREYECPHVKNDVIRTYFSPDGKVLACSHMNNIYLLDSKTGTVLRTLEAHLRGISALEFSPDGSHLAAGGQLGRSIRIWNVETGQRTAELTGHLEAVLNIQFLANDRLISSDAKGFALWDVPSQVQYYYHTYGKCSHDLIEPARQRDRGPHSYAVVLPREDWLVVAILNQDPQFLELDVSDIPVQQPDRATPR